MKSMSFTVLVQTRNARIRENHTAIRATKIYLLNHVQLGTYM